MSERDGLVRVLDLQVDPRLHAFLEKEALPGSEVDPATFWAKLSELVRAFTPRNQALLDERQRLQDAIDAWHRERPGPIEPEAYAGFLREIGYLEPLPAPFAVELTGIDPEIATTPGPQLVVPVSNARYALNAANARWGSLYDALYGTDALGDSPPPGPYDPARGDRVVAWTRDFLDRSLPLSEGSHHDLVAYAVGEDGHLQMQGAAGHVRALANPKAFVGARVDGSGAQRLLFRHHGLGIELRIDRDDPVGARDRAGVADVELESAVTTIMDCEDSVAAVDGEDKTQVYRHWLGLMRGDLAESFVKNGEAVTRRLAQDRRYRTPGGGEERLSGRSLLLVRNVGLLMTTPAVLDAVGNEVFEGLLDALCTALAAKHDLLRKSAERGNSRAGSIYVVKPKLHGPAEVRFACELMAFVEAALELPAQTIKLGIMDEERRTSVNLAACIAEARDRVAFINTGFLDRTGDEIHTSFHAGPAVPKAAMKRTPWIAAYEAGNVRTGLDCGLGGRAQIGKGMWAMPDRMAEMLEQKRAHPEAGATCAWVPSPSAATLHAVHYHEVDAFARQRALRDAAPPDPATLLQLPLGDPKGGSASDRRFEIENNVQGILGYVVRWIDQGVGCSKVPDRNDVGLMEDRATCRISSQHLANWLAHGVISRDEVEDAFRRMAEVVDRQNADDPEYVAMAPGFDGLAFEAARALVFDGATQPSGYTEPLLHAFRRRRKQELAQG
ncbi:MAG: malate synthase G [Myxococcota bacterium]